LIVTVNRAVSVPEVIVVKKPDDDVGRMQLDRFLGQQTVIMGGTIAEHTKVINSLVGELFQYGRPGVHHLGRIPIGE
jgi:hypothetical protein